MFGTSYFGTEELRHQSLTSAPSSIGMLTSAPCKKITCAEVNEIFQNLCRSSCAEVHPCRSSITWLKMVQDAFLLKWPLRLGDF